MDNTLFYIIAGAVVVVFVIVLNKKKQKSTLDKFIQDSADAEPIFLIQSVEKKLLSLHNLLYVDALESVGAGDTYADDKLQTFADELERLKCDYESKKLSLTAYNDCLHALQLKVGKLQN
jgi:hypothetical protein